MWCRSEVSSLLPARDGVGGRGWPMGAALSFVTGDSQLPTRIGQMSGELLPGPSRPGNRSSLRDGDPAETVRMRERAWQWAEPECPSPGRYRPAEWGRVQQNDRAGPVPGCRPDARTALGGSSFDDHSRRISRASTVCTSSASGGSGAQKQRRKSPSTAAATPARSNGSATYGARNASRPSVHRTASG